MDKNFKVLQEKMSPQSRARSEAKAERILGEMALNELRAARRLTQERLARKLHKGQPAISKMENSVDMYVSTLQQAISAMGGALEILAVFPEATIRINQFRKLPGRRRKVERGRGRLG